MPVWQLQVKEGKWKTTWKGQNESVSRAKLSGYRVLIIWSLVYSCYTHVIGVKCAFNNTEMYSRGLACAAHTSAPTFIIALCSAGGWSSFFCLWSSQRSSAGVPLQSGVSIHPLPLWARPSEGRPYVQHTNTYTQRCPPDKMPIERLFETSWFFNF